MTRQVVQGVASEKASFCCFQTPPSACHVLSESPEVQWQQFPPSHGCLPPSFHPAGVACKGSRPTFENPDPQNGTLRKGRTHVVSFCQGTFLLVPKGNKEPGYFGGPLWLRIHFTFCQWPKGKQTLYILQLGLSPCIFRHTRFGVSDLLGRAGGGQGGQGEAPALRADAPHLALL